MKYDEMTDEELINSEGDTIFKSYLRLLLRELKDLKKSIKEKDLDRAEELINGLIEDTIKDIETEN